MLQEQRIGIDGVYTFDKVQVAIERLRAFEALALEYSPEGYYLCDSGGKALPKDDGQISFDDEEEEDDGI